MPRQKKPEGEQPPKMSARDKRRQASFLDVAIEDVDLARHLKTLDDFENARDAYNKAQKSIKEIVAAKYEHAINSNRDGMNSGYVRCGVYRFRADVTEKPETPVPAKPATTRPASKRWGKLDVHSVNLFSGDPMAGAG